MLENNEINIKKLIIQLLQRFQVFQIKIYTCFLFKEKLTEESIQEPWYLWLVCTSSPAPSGRPITQVPTYFEPKQKLEIMLYKVQCIFHNL